MEDKFYDIIGYEECYQINPITAEIRSLDRFTKTGHKYAKPNIEYKMLKKGKILKQILNKKGYPALGLSKNNKTKRITVHRLLAIQFIPNPENKPEVNHKDGNKLNNSLDNLEWCTAKENSIHAVRTGLRVAAKGEKNHLYGKKGEQAICYGRKGILHPLSKTVLDLETGIFYDSAEDAATAKNIKTSTLRARMSRGLKKNTTLIYV